MNSIRITVTPNNPGRIPDQYQDNDKRYSIDLAPNVNFPLSFQNDSEFEGEENPIAFSSSYVVDIPWTPKNELLLEHIGDPNIFNSKIWFERTIPAIVWIRSEDSINGSLVVTNVKRNRGEIAGWQIIIIEGAKLWVEQLKSLKINELDLGTYRYFLPDVEANMKLTDPVYDPNNLTIYYPAIFRGELSEATPQNSNNWQVEDFEPVPFLKFLIDKMFEKIGWRLISKFMDSKAFKKLGVELIEGWGYSNDLVTDIAIYVGRQGQQFINTTGQFLLEFNNESGDFFDQSDLYNDDVAFTYVAPFDILTNIELNTSIFYSGVGIVGEFRLEVYRGTQSIFDNTYNVQTVDINETFNNTYLLAGQIVFVRITNFSNQQMVIQEESSLRIDVEKFIPRGSIITLTNFIDSRHLCWPMLLDVIKLFGLKHATNTETKTIVLEPAIQYESWDNVVRDGFYKSTTVDWSKKIIACKDVNVRIDEPARYYSFRFVEDSNDKYANSTRIENNNSSVRVHELWYDIKTDLPNLSCSGEKSIQLDFFATTRQARTGNACDVPVITDQEIVITNGGVIAYNEEGQRTLRHAPRILYMKGWGTPFSSQFNFEGVNYNEYPIAFQASRYFDNEPNIAFDSVVKINPSTRGIRKGLFEIFLKNYTWMKNLNGASEFFAVLSELDLIQLDPRMKIQYNGNRYLLKLIDKWLANEPNTPTKIKLLLDRLNYNG